ncbi:MAG: FIST C-terminal domain-containing protein [Clostridiales Family XIII bacterium]|jgi:hypothetical protein|nr:FIST C-terminal domain-containing protein [Clostridiales Family XIII bacterium]
MIKTIYAHTAEIDDVSAAISEIKDQISAEGGLLKNTVGIVGAFSDFVESGVVKALSETFPFDIVGITTIAAGGSGLNELMSLRLTILTSDDVRFATALTAPIKESSGEVIAAGYREAASKFEDEPALIIPHAPLLMTVSGDSYVRALDEASGGIPVFGAVPVDHTIDYHESKVIYGGEAYYESMAILLVFGDIKPKFYIGTILKEKLLREKGEITSSTANVLHEINGKVARDYLVSKGLTADESGDIPAINANPFIIDFNDGSNKSIVRAAFAVTPDGSVVCGGDVPVGSYLTVGYVDEESLVASSVEVIDELIADGKKDVFLAYSCVGRYFYLKFDPEVEINAMREAMEKAGEPWSLIYAGGEICTLPQEDDETVRNRFHNVTLVMCTF